MQTDILRLPAEWEPTEGVLIAWPHKNTDWAEMLEDVERCYCELAHAIARHARLIVIGPDLKSARDMLNDIPDERICFFQCMTNDTWTRDYGPITTLTDNSVVRANDFVFNGWGLKFASDHDNRATRRMVDAKLIDPGIYVNRLDLVLEGGSIDSDGAGTILTTSECLLSPNRNASLSRQDIENHIKEYLGARRVLWLDHGYLAGDDTDSHIDTLARLAPHNTIVYTGCDDPTDEHFTSLRDMASQLSEFRTADGATYNLIELPLPDPIYDEDGERLPATYANYLPLNDAVLVPSYGQKRK
ncbi:MAG: agmatine deiminase family protein, partial [Muribaculaceae bacterium]|nr:agmatine deiminase family protein [Muribaculaceae bacterium]